MRRIAHISDLHFGTEDPPVAAGLLVDLAEHRPHVVAVSGDLTQRALDSQFASAKAYLDQMPFPKIVVPGNHDQPLYNLAHRLLWPLHRYKKWITPDLRPVLQDEELTVVGINTARRDTHKSGRVSMEQIHWLRETLCAAPREHFRVLVAHHPVIPPQHNPQETVVARAKLMLQTLDGCGCSLILAGHLHKAYSGDARPYHVEIKRSILVFQAGTAISHRRRDEANAYNLITIDGDRLQLEVRAWDGAQFTTLSQREYEQKEHGWTVQRTSSASEPGSGSLR
jgi:3',5'-cyclic AMP phosphodiesterase CpdA